MNAQRHHSSSTSKLTWNSRSSRSAASTSSTVSVNMRSDPPRNLLSVHFLKEPAFVSGFWGRARALGVHGSASIRLKLTVEDLVMGHMWKASSLGLSKSTTRLPKRAVVGTILPEITDLWN